MINARIIIKEVGSLQKKNRSRQISVTRAIASQDMEHARIWDLKIAITLVVGAMTDASKHARAKLQQHIYQPNKKHVETQ